MRSVYILLARTETIFSKAIHAATGDPYTHSSLALDRELTQMYSFARRWKRLPCFGGFIRERVDRGIYGENPHAPCALYELSVSEEAYARLSVCVGDLYAQRFRWRYNYLGAAANFWGKSRRGKRSRFCSEFVAQALLDAGAIPKCPESQPFLDPARVRPSMF
ncbi:MAG: hypothetical protein VB049_00935, partial [Candidatus Pelethousia sp.]|nr:hypothetical protein [Candidatus Pelethousia sp.]